MSSGEVHANNRQYEMMGHHSEEHGIKVRKTIWKMFWVLLAITTIEVLLGIFWVDMGLHWQVVKWTFIVMTVAKAYFIVAYYMHMKDEWKSVAWTIVAPYTAFVLYLIFICLYEALAVKGSDILW